MARNRENSSQKGLFQLLRFRTTILILVILLVGFGAVAVRLFYLQLIQGPELQELAVDQQLVDTKLSAKRGTIYDCNGKILAQSASVWQVIIAPAYIETNEQRRYIAKNLSKILDLDYDNVLEKTKQDSYYVIVKRKIESDEREKILKFCDKLEDKYSKLSN